MTKTISNKATALIAILLSTVFILSTCMLAVAESENSVSASLHVAQLIYGGAEPDTVTGEYAVIPNKEDNPMPPSGDELFNIQGNTEKVLTFTFTEPGNYEYTIGKLKDSKKTSDITVDNFEKGTEEHPLTHPIGFQVKQNADGTLSVIPYTCYDGQAVISKDGSSMTLWNYVYAKGQDSSTDKSTDKSTEKSTTSTTKKSSSTITTTKQSTTVIPVTNSNKTPVTNSNGTIQTTIKYIYTNGTVLATTKKGGSVNTGDESQTVLWVTIAGVSALGLVVIFIIRRKTDDDEEESI